MNNKKIRIDQNCRICDSNKIINVFELKPTPSGDRFVSKSKINQNSEKFPLILSICNECSYLHLPYVLNPKVSYTDYVYETKITVGLSKHYMDYAQEIIDYGGVKPSSLVIDLGSNDGTMLKAFKEVGMNILGVEPNQNIADLANKNQLNTINNYFSHSVASKIVKQYGRASIITANYMFANIDNIIDFTDNAKKILSDDGLFVVQTGYHPAQMTINMFDYIYHEHFSYFSVKVLKDLFEKSGLELIHVSSQSSKGGSIRTISQHMGGKRKSDKSVDAFISKEKEDKIHESKTYMNFAKRINEKRDILVEFIKNIKAESKTIVGYGASVSTTTLLHHFEIGQYLDYIVDDNTIKHGLFSPGYHLPVYSSRKLYSDKPDYVLILGWQHQDSIIKRNKKYIDDGGKFVIPLPKLKVISK